MLVVEKEVRLQRPKNNAGILDYFRKELVQALSNGEIPVRFVVTKTDDDSFNCELGVLSGLDKKASAIPSIFDFRKRKIERAGQFNAVLVIPTGVGAQLGGHSGDAGALARLAASVCDNLITHPNVVNAADINELPENGLYVEGSVVSRFLMGTVGLQKVRSNRVLLMVEEHDDKMFHELSINSASAARFGLGLDCPLVIKMKNTILMRAVYSASGRAVGRIEGLGNLCRVLEQYRGNYDAVALATLIQVPKHYHSEYFSDETGDMVNPWGGVEAMLTHAVSLLFDVPSAHSPMMTSKEIMNLDVGIVDPRKAAEAVSTTYLHCVLKGLHRSPRIVTDSEAIFQPGVLTVEDVSCLIIPEGCIGLPTLAALEQGIPVIAVRENKNCMQNRFEDLPFLPGKLFMVENHLEAIGVMAALRAGVAVDTVRRPAIQTEVLDVDAGEAIETIGETLSEQRETKISD